MKQLRLGLDLGTSSVGWALLDENNKIIKKNGHSFWGVRLFDEGKTALDRRMSRTNRRRLKRRNERVHIVRELFANEISKNDPTFFERLDDSFYFQEDKKNKNYYNLFVDNKYTDKEFFHKYPTIYHLRKAIMEEDRKFDIRMLYLAVVHIVKYRGNFLFTGEFNINQNTIVKEFFNEFNETLIELKQEFEESDEEFSNEEFFDIIDIKNDEFYDEFKNIMTNCEGIKNKKDKLLKLFKVNKKSIYNEYVIPLLAGTKANATQLSCIKDLKYEKKEINLSSETLTDDLYDIENISKELYGVYELTEKLKGVYDYYFVTNVLGDNDSISNAMINIYNDHQSDLLRLKNFIKNYNKKCYNEVFRKVTDKLNNYPAYIGFNDVNNKKERFKHATREDFYKYLNNIFANIHDEIAKSEIESEIESKIESEIEYFTKKIENNKFLLKQNSNQNGAFPKQLHYKELEKILNNQSKYYDFLKYQDESGYSVKDKILKTFNYKIEYYIGPLNTKSNNAWVVRNSYDKIYPWNIDKIVNKDESAKEFIKRMQNKCTYLDSEYCLPKSSIIFSKYNCYSYLNKLTINGKLINNNIKEKVFNEIFLKIKQPTSKIIFDYIKTNFGEVKTTNKKDIPDVTCNMASYIKMCDIFGEEYVEKNINIIENLIQDITIFEDKTILISRLKKLYRLDDDKIKEIKGLNYKGYSRLSNKLLNGLYMINKSTGEVYGTVLDIMISSNLNLQEILYNSPYRLIDIIDEENKKNLNKDNLTLNDYIDDNVAVSPAFKRSIIQAYTVIEEIEKIFNRPIDEYYVECTRTNNAKKKKTQSRYEKIKELYKTINNDDLKILNQQLEDYKESLKSDLLYLYFTQLGKCMYSLEPINLEELISSNNKYDIDHIYPQSIIKDDSISNRVLVRKDLNAKKTDKFLFDTDVLNKDAYKFYEILLEHNLITKEKYKRLTKKELTESELDGFVNRQLVSTNQSVTGLIKVLKEYHNVNPSNIIYSKAENVSDFRHKFDIVKSRTANNYHHAHDAYLNVIVGGVLDKYYKSKDLYFFKDLERIKSEHQTLNPMVVFAGRHNDENKIVKDKHGNVIWNRNLNIAQINKDIFNRFDITETHKTLNSNKLYSHETIRPRGGKCNVPLKEGIRGNMDKYGGVESPSFSRYVIVEVENKKGKSYILEAIPKYAIPNHNTIEVDVLKYLKTIYVKKDKPLYSNINVINYNIKTNAIILDNNKKYVITGKTNDNYLLKNVIDRNFSKNAIKIIKKLNKFVDSKMDIGINKDEIIISPARNEETKPIILTKTETKDLLNEILKMYSKNIYAYSPIIKLVNIINVNKDYSFSELIQLDFELLKLLKTNERTLCNLKVIDESENYGTFMISKNLKSGTKFIAESITGYYKKLLFEVK